MILFLDALRFFTKFPLVEDLFINDSNGFGTTFSLINEEYTTYGREKQFPTNGTSWGHKEILINYTILVKAKQNLSRKDFF